MNLGHKTLLSSISLFQDLKINNTDDVTTAQNSTLDFVE